MLLFESLQSSRKDLEGVTLVSANYIYTMSVSITVVALNIRRNATLEVNFTGVVRYRIKDMELNILGGREIYW